MMYGRHLGFWLVTFVVFVAVLWLLRDILLPFVAGAALAYLLTPLADRLERLGINRMIAALLIVGAVVLTLLGLAFLLVPLLLQHGSLLITRIPGYVKRIQELVVDPSFPWLNWFAPGDRRNGSRSIHRVPGRAGAGGPRPEGHSGCGGRATRRARRHSGDRDRSPFGTRRRP